MSCFLAAMLRRPSLFLALLLLTSSAALARGKVPLKPAEVSDAPDDLELIGWSKDETRFAVRIFEASGVGNDDLNEPPPYCPGYVNARGKKFHGGLRLQLYEDTQFTQTWQIHPSQPCTPPEMARERLAQAKEALTEKGIDLSALGVVVTSPRKPTKRPPLKGKPRTMVTTSLTRLVLPSGPWAQQSIEILCRAEQRVTYKSPKDVQAAFTSRATFIVSLRAGKRLTRLHEFTLGPFEGSTVTAGVWAPTVDRLFLSPSGKSVVLLAHLDEGTLHDTTASSVVLGLVELPEPPLREARQAHEMKPDLQ